MLLYENNIVNTMRAIVHVVIMFYVQNLLLSIAVYGLDTAMIDVVLVENNSGKYTTLTYHVKGRFSRAGAVTSAEGDILQVISVCPLDIYFAHVKL